MKTKITKLQRIIFSMLLFVLPLGAFSQSTVLAYVCGSGSVTLVPDLKGYTLQAGDVVRWRNVATGVEVDQATANYTPTALDIGNNEYTVQIRPFAPEACLGDVSLPYVIHKLPTFTVPISASFLTYCTETGTPSTISAVPTLPTTGLPSNYTLPSDVTYAYTWTATDATAGTVGIGTLGTNVAGTFTMLNNAPTGNFNITASVSYSVTSSISLIPAAGCQVSSDAQNIIVTSQPTQPTISILVTP